ncbi:MAG: hypothetical protein DI551_00110 [Micavibrio aeruginosavorus]|uniref:Uncharacterized protein n=1 Tax=Micavibrio aeruginosavorus TaxID=349221 RepID=A0A2W5N6J4_9BACT|nr:MAG: hypothetical protein DI551_00110 [Micavibrio aeruginosavorus]
MFKDAFTKLDSTQAARMAERINPHLDIKMDPATTTVMVHPLSFYPDHTLVELSRHDQYPPVTRAAVLHDKSDKITVLNWTNETIHALNKSAPIALDETNMADYVRFFFHYVRGAHGRFIIIDTVDDIDWREEPAPAGRKALGKMIDPLRIESREKDGTVVFNMCIVFKDSLFAAEAHLKPDGKISMQNEELLVEDIPVADDILGQ